MLPLHDTLTAVALTAVISTDSGLSESEVDKYDRDEYRRTV